MANKVKRDGLPAAGSVPTKEAAAFLGVSTGRVRQLVGDGSLQAIRIGGGGDTSGNHAISVTSLRTWKASSTQRTNNGPPLPKGLLSRLEAAEQLGLSGERVRQLIAEGALKAERNGRRIGIRPADLAAYLEQRRAS